MIHIFHFILHVIGVDDISGPWYGFWSGFGSDLGELGLAVAFLITFYPKHNCHVKGCWRVGRRPIGSAGLVVCHRHHPRGAPTHEEILKQFRTSDSNE